MKILIRHEDFSTSYYELHIADSSINFIGESENFSLPFTEICDFCITFEKYEKSYFTILCSKQIYEGQIIDKSDVEPFLEMLKNKLNGVIHVNVRKN